jgi:H+/gluconate symporter-like permease
VYSHGQVKSCMLRSLTGSKSGTVIFTLKVLLTLLEIYEETVTVCLFIRCAVYSIFCFLKDKGEDWHKEGPHKSM